MSANIVSVDEESLRRDIKNLMRKTVEETLNALLDEEALGLVGAERYERTAGREAYRGGLTGVLEDLHGFLSSFDFHQMKKAGAMDKMDALLSYIAAS